MSEELHVTTETELRLKIDIVAPWLGNETRLKEDRPYLYAQWIDYRKRHQPTPATAINGVEYERMFNKWLLHYFLVHGKK